MSEKVRLPKEVCDALDLGIKEGMNRASIVSRIYFSRFPEDSTYKILNSQDANEIMRALVLGYEPEMTAEERIKDVWNTPYFMKNMSNWAAYQEGIKCALHIHGIRYDWMEDAE